MIEQIDRPNPLVLLAEDVIYDNPPPHHLIGEIHIDEDTLGLAATAFFPSTDPSIAERGHVNWIHFSAAAQNGAHVLRNLQGFNESLAGEALCKTHRFTDPDSTMNMQIRIHEPDIRERVGGGVLVATFTMGEDPDPYATVRSSFIVKKR